MVHEINYLVPKYLDSLGILEGNAELSQVLPLLKNVKTYWDRLENLLKNAGNWEEEMPMKQAIKESLQSELIVLEKIYVPLHQAIHSGQAFWSKELWETAEVVLKRMDQTLEGLGFEKNHIDRKWVKETLYQVNHFCKPQL